MRTLAKSKLNVTSASENYMLEGSPKSIEDHTGSTVLVNTHLWNSWESLKGGQHG